MKIILRNNRSNGYNWRIIWYRGNILVTDGKWYLSKYSLENTCTHLSISSEIQHLSFSYLSMLLKFSITRHWSLKGKNYSVIDHWAILLIFQKTIVSSTSTCCVARNFARASLLSLRGYKRVYAQVTNHRLSWLVPLTYKQLQDKPSSINHA